MCTRFASGYNLSQTLRRFHVHFWYKMKDYLKNMIKRHLKKNNRKIYNMNLFKYSMVLATEIVYREGNYFIQNV